MGQLPLFDAAVMGVAVLALVQLVIWALQAGDTYLNNKRAREWRQLNMLTDAQCALHAKRRRDARQVNLRG